MPSCCLYVKKFDNKRFSGPNMSVARKNEKTKKRKNHVDAQILNTRETK